MATIKDVVTAAVSKVANEVKKKKEPTETTSTTTTTETSAPASNGGMSSYVKSDSSRGTSTNYGTYKDDLDRLTQAQRQAQISELKAARKRALANLDVQEQNIKPTYQNARNMTSAASQQGARTFSEYLANRGLTNSGAAAQGEINRLSALQNNLGNLNTAEANAYRDIANQRTAVENDYVAGLANANNAITNNYYNNLLNYNQQQRQMVQQLQNQALGQYANDYQAQIDNLLAQGYSQNSLEVLQLQALRGNKANNLYQAGQSNALANIQAGNINYNNAAAAGMTVEQAQNYYNQLQAQKQAQALAEQQALEREIAQQQWKNNMDYNNYLLNAQKVVNDTAQTQYNVNKPYNTTIRYVSSGGNGNTPKQLGLKDVMSILNNVQDANDKQKTIDYLYNTNQISDELFDYFQ